MTQNDKKKNYICQNGNCIRHHPEHSGNEDCEEKGVGGAGGDGRKIGIMSLEHCSGCKGWREDFEKIWSESHPNHCFAETRITSFIESLLAEKGSEWKQAQAEIITRTYKNSRIQALREAIEVIKKIDFEKISDDGHSALISKLEVLDTLRSLMSKEKETKT